MQKLSSLLLQWFSPAGRESALWPLQRRALPAWCSYFLCLTATCVPAGSSAHDLLANTGEVPLCAPALLWSGCSLSCAGGQGQGSSFPHSSSAVWKNFMPWVGLSNICGSAVKQRSGLISRISEEFTILWLVISLTLAGFGGSESPAAQWCSFCCLGTSLCLQAGQELAAPVSSIHPRNMGSALGRFTAKFVNV